MKKMLALGLIALSSASFAQTYEQGSEVTPAGENGNYISDSRYGNGPQQEMQETADRVPAAAQGMRHMFEFNIDSVEALAVSFDKVKTKGQESDNESNINLDMNYAYGVHPLMQVGMRFNYFSGVNGPEDQENLGLSVGAIVNGGEDFTNAPYISGYVGAGYAQQFGDGSSRDDLRFATLALGKRFSLESFGLKHVVYSPEVAVKFLSSTTGESLDYSQSLQFRVVQFSVFF